MTSNTELDKIKEMIDLAPNKKHCDVPSLVSTARNNYAINSILYAGGIFLDNVTNIRDIYDVVKYEKLDPNLFNKPFYIDITLNICDGKTIDIINQFNDRVLIEIYCKDLNEKDFVTLLKVKHPKVRFHIDQWIKLDHLYTLAKCHIISRNSSPIVFIDKIDENTIKKMNFVADKMNNFLFKTTVKSKQDLQNICKYVQEMPNVETNIEIDDLLFNYDNPENARDLILGDDSALDFKNDKFHLRYLDMDYKSIYQIYELERDIELLKSHVLSDTNQLDIVTYIVSFIINYFTYDMSLRAFCGDPRGNINLLELLQRGRGVCRHFARLTKCLLNAFGVECELVDGHDHVFNVVKVNGKMCFLDTTWVLCNMHDGVCHSLAESTDFLRSRENFDHEEYKEVLEEYNCVDYDRNEINESVKRVMGWRKNYQIHFQSLKDLLMKYLKKKEMTVEERIETAISRRR